MIYHFTVPGYGNCFRDIAARFERENRITITTVLSGRALKAQSAPLSIRRAVAQLREARRRLGRAERTVVTFDVNQYVIEAVSPGSHGVITGFDQILRPRAIERFATIVNFHPSILPAYKGPRPTADAFHNGETRGGWTIHEVTGDIDGGPILDQEVVDLAGLMSVQDIDARLSLHQVVGFERWLRHVALGQPWSSRRVDPADVYHRSTAPDRTGPIPPGGADGG